MLVTGGHAEQRLSIAHSFHRRSPIAHEAFLALDCRRDAGRVEQLLHSWLLACLGGDGQRRRIGALFLDSIGALAATSQRSLLTLARRIDAAPEVPRTGFEPGPLRLMAGDPAHLGREPLGGSCSTPLLDHLDKIRVELDASRTRGAA